MIGILRRDKEILKTLFQTHQQTSRDRLQLVNDLVSYIIKKEMHDCPKQVGQTQVAACILQIAFGSSSKD